MDLIGPMKENKPLTVFLALRTAFHSSIVLCESFGGIHADKDIPAVISISSDDGFASVYRTAFPIFKEKGIPAFRNRDRMGLPGHLNLSQLTEMQNSGWETGSRAMHHVRLTTLNETSLSNEVVESKRLLMPHGSNVSSFAYPFSDMNENVVKVMSSNYVAARLTAGPNDYIGYYPEIVKKQEFIVEAMSADTDFQTIRRNIDTAVERHEWINFHFHGVQKDGRMRENPSWTLTDITDYIRERVDAGVLIPMTFVDAYNFHLRLSNLHPMWQSVLEGPSEDFPIKLTKTTFRNYRLKTPINLCLYEIPFTISIILSTSSNLRS